MKTDPTPRQRWIAKENERLIFYALSFLAGAVAFYFLFAFASTLLYPRDMIITLNGQRVTLQEALAYADELKERARKVRSYKEKVRLEEKADRIKDAIARAFPPPNLQNLQDSRVHPHTKLRYWGLWVVGFVLVMAPWAFFARKVFGEWKLFFIREALREPPIKYGKARDFIKWEKLGDVRRDEAIKLLFGTEERYKEVLSFFDANIIADNRLKTPEQIKKMRKKGLPVVIFNAHEISKEIAGHIQKIADWGVNAGVLSKENVKHFKIVMMFTLFHYVAGLYGNIPAGFLVTRLEDYTAKRVISIYTTRKRVITLLKGRRVMEDELTSSFLDALHSYTDNAYDRSVFEILRDKFNPLPFVMFAEEA